MSKKGSSYERIICTTLSQWWTNGKRTDVFWRTAGSGNRAKVRGRSGKNTSGQHGDITATDPIGSVLIDLLTIEIKRGYSKFTVADLLDKSSTHATQEIEKWIIQAEESHEQSGSFAWMLITKRDQRMPLVFIPRYLLTHLSRLKALDPRPIPFMLLSVPVGDCPCVELCALTLEAFLSGVSPEHVRELAKTC